MCLFVILRRPWQALSCDWRSIHRLSDALVGLGIEKGE
jgi:hypothetical protein